MPWLMVFTGVAAIALAVSLASPPGRAAADVEVQRDVTYYSGPDTDPARHQLDLYLPVGRSRFPVVVFVHGGGWTSGSRRNHANIGQALAARGIGVAAIDYRLADGGPSSAGHPDQVIDVVRAVAFMRAAMIVRGIPPGELFLMGQGAGAHLAALAATNPRFLGLVGLAPGDLRGFIGLSGTYALDPGSRAYANVFGVDPALRLDASPLHHASAGDPPCLLLYAADDLPHRDAEALGMAEALAGAGVHAGAGAVAERDFETLSAAIGRPDDPATDQIVGFIAGLSSLAPAGPSLTPQPTEIPAETAPPPAPPTQPAEGPGGTLRPHAATTARLLVDGSGEPLAWILAPADPSATPDSPRTPDPSATPDSPRTPDPSATPDSPRTPDPSATPDSPGTPDPSATPDSPGTPTPPVASDSTATAEQPTTPEPTKTPDLPVGTRLPVVVFLGDAVGQAGVGGRPAGEDYAAWLDHIARGGAIVILPVLPAAQVPRAGAWTAGLAAALRQTLEILDREDAALPRARPDRERLAFVGHGQGAVIAANLAGEWFERRLPVPRALLLMMPRDPAGVLTPASLPRIPRDTQTLFVAADRGGGYDDPAEALLWDGTAHLPNTWRNRLIIAGDSHGVPALTADARTPLSGGPDGGTDALDWYGPWKWLDGLTACAWSGLDCAYAFGGTVRQTVLGSWSDGQPVNPARLAGDPVRPIRWLSFLPAVSRDYRPPRR